MTDENDDPQITKIQTLTFKPENFQSGSLMRVIETVNGEARIICNEEDHTYLQVHLHVCGCAYLNKGDLVSITATECGIVILNKIRSTKYNMPDTFDDTNVTKIQTTAYNPENFQLICYIMTVKESVDGNARIVIDEKNNTSFEIQTHLSGVPFLIEHDKVLVNNTTSGFAVYDKLRAAGESPCPQFVQLQDGSFQLLDKQDITYVCGNTSIHVTAEGDIRVNGQPFKIEPE